MSKPSVHRNFPEWILLPIEDRLEDMIDLYCTGPCGQSNFVSNQREGTSRTLKEAICKIKELTKELQETKHNLYLQFQSDPRTNCGRGWGD